MRLVTKTREFKVALSFFLFLKSYWIGVRGDDWWIDTSISYLCCHVACHKCALVLVNLKCQNQVVCVPVLSQSGPFTSFSSVSITMVHSQENPQFFHDSKLIEWK